MCGSFKGGVGKTASSWNLAYSLAEMGKRVLAVDFDSQANLTTCFGAEDPAAVPVTIGHLMMNRLEDEEVPDPSEFIQSRNGVDFIPSSMMLSAVDSKLRMEMGSEKMLTGILEPLRGLYDYIIVDTCPSLGTLTIVSANDETQMGLDHGWHYETITFLRQLEKIDEDTKILIPTKNIYFFIEKIPLDHSVSYAGSGQSISKKGASQTLPNVGGIGMYQGEKRWIVMSRMYYWVQAFMKKYPNEMKVYYEDDQFICYRIPQNMYHQYNFAIDYGYNQVETEEQEAEQ